MKTIIAAIISLAIGKNLVYAQGGLISWQAATGHPMTNSTPYATGYPSTTGGVSGFTSSSGAGLYYFVLLAATSTTANDSGNPFGSDWSPVTYNGTGTPALGTNNVVAGSVTGLGGTAGFASDLVAGTTYFDMVVGWSASLGADWATASGYGPSFASSPFGHVGYSNVGTITPTSAPANGALIFGGSSAQPGQTILYATEPEPATTVLFGLGALSALLLRSRKA
jgi:hypothetical protein